MIQSNPFPAFETQIGVGEEPKKSIPMWIPQNLELLSRIRLTPFKFHDRYHKNATVSGFLCFAESLAQFETNCRNKMAKSIENTANLPIKWIVVTKFNYIATNSFLMEKSKL